MEKWRFSSSAICFRIGDGVRVDIKTVNDHGFRFTSHCSIQNSPSLFDVTATVLQLLAKVTVSFCFHFNINFISNLLIFKSVIWVMVFGMFLSVYMQITQEPFLSQIFINKWGIGVFDFP